MKQPSPVRTFRSEKVPVPPDFRPFVLQPGFPLDIEIGCGVGLHAIRYAKTHSSRQMIAIERTSEKFAKFRGRLAGHKPISNLIPIHGDAVAWITHGIKQASVDRYFLLYPNPHPKESQRNQRWYEMPFCSFLIETLKPGGSLTLATNQEFYAEEAKRSFRKWGLNLEGNSLVLPTEIPRTHFEKKYLLRGERCHNLVFRR